MSSGERKRKSLNSDLSEGCGALNTKTGKGSGMFWNGQPKRVKALYAKPDNCFFKVPKYHDEQNFVGIWLDHQPRLNTLADR